MNAVYSVNSIVLLDGSIQLKKINIIDQGCIEYEVNLFGKNANLFNEIGENKLEELDISTYNHALTMVNQSDSWATQIQVGGSPVPFDLGTGYVYPYIDYGFSNSSNEFEVAHFYPAIYAREYLLRIFQEAGYSWNSAFLDSAFFKSQIIPYNGKDLRISDTQVNNRTVIVQAVAPLSIGVTETAVASTLTFTTEVQDIDNQITVPSTSIVVGQTGFYNVIGELNYTGDFTPSTGVLVKPMVMIKVDVQVRVNSTTVASNKIYITPDGAFSGAYSTATNPSPPSDEYWSDLSGSGVPITNNPYNPASISIGQNPSVYLTAGDVVTVRAVHKLVRAFPYGTMILAATDKFEDDATTGTYYDGTIRLNVEAVDFRMIPVPVNILEGENVDMNGAIPKDVKQSDYFKGIINKHNLFVQPQKFNPLVLDIEPRDDFYGDDVTDWSEKLDTKKKILVKPLGSLKFREFIFKDKADKDYYNEDYENTYNETYGQRDYILNNEFLKGTKKIQTVFSPTPLVGHSSNDRVVSEIFKTDSSNNKVNLDQNIRILQYGGLKATNQSWTHQSNIGSDVVRTNYAYAGHLDDPYNPTTDLNWGLPKKIYYNNTFNTVNFTVNGAVNKYWYNYINEISNVNSKEVTAYFNLTSKDISELDFKNLYYFNGDYFRLQKVSDYNPVGKSLTKCQFIKYAEVVNFTDTSFVLNGGEGEVVGGVDPVPKPTNSSSEFLSKNVR